MDGFPSGQRGQTVNLLQIASVVRIHLHPLLIRHIYKLIEYNVISLKINIAGWSSLEARRAHNPKVIGSNPIPATNLIFVMVPWCSWLTRLPVTQKIAGSSPVGTAIWLHSSVGRARD